MDNQIELRAAKLLLDEAISKLRESVFPAGCEEGKKGDKEFGVELAQRIEYHKNKIDKALSHWEQCFSYYKEIKNQTYIIPQEMGSNNSKETILGRF